MLFRFMMLHYDLGTSRYTIEFQSHIYSQMGDNWLATRFTSSFVIKAMWSLYHQLTLQLPAAKFQKGMQNSLPYQLSVTIRWLSQAWVSCPILIQLELSWVESDRGVNEPLVYLSYHCYFSWLLSLKVSEKIAFVIAPVSWIQLDGWVDPTPLSQSAVSTCLPSLLILAYCQISMPSILTITRWAWQVSNWLEVQVVGKLLALV